MNFSAIVIARVVGAGVAVVLDDRLINNDLELPSAVARVLLAEDRRVLLYDLILARRFRATDAFDTGVQITLADVGFAVSRCDTLRRGGVRCAVVYCVRLCIRAAISFDVRAAINNRVGLNVGLGIGLNVGLRIRLNVGLCIGLCIRLDVGLSVRRDVGLRIGLGVRRISFCVAPASICLGLTFIDIVAINRSDEFASKRGTHEGDHERYPT